MRGGVEAAGEARQSSEIWYGHAKGRQRLSPKTPVTWPRIASPSAEKAGSGGVSPGKRDSFSRAGMDVSRAATEWWAGQDSNLRQHPYERHVLISSTTGPMRRTEDRDRRTGRMARA